MALGGQYRRVCEPDVRHTGPYRAVVPLGREADGVKHMNSQMSYSGNYSVGQHNSTNFLAKNSMMYFS